jgi:hypothetical protein
MFSEVYWHHAVRSATAMLQRAVWILRPRIIADELVTFDDQAFIRWASAAAADGPAAVLVTGLFGPQRKLHKRVAAFDQLHDAAVHRALAGRGYESLVAVSGRLADLASRRCGRTIDPHTLLIDAPPSEREIEFSLAVRERGGRDRDAVAWRWGRLADRSPIVRSLAREQFDDVVKRVRIFAAGEDAAALATCPHLEDLVLEAAEA